ncbi:MAG: gamma-glutamyl-gamma-aminobutyrate hydrolase family protein [Dehalococcoidia bacterium]
MSKPRIAVTARANVNLDDVTRYADAVRLAGGDPVTVWAYHDDTIDGIDGVLLTGGGDINPRVYNQPRDPRTKYVNDERDQFELALAKDALIRDLPVLAICRGFQLLNVLCDGSLVQHVDGHSANSGPHEIDITPGTKLAEALGTSERVMVNSRHHQAVRETERAETLVVSAVSPDGLIEALESPRHRWVVGVQCHPERADEVDPRFAGLFEHFIQAARGWYRG